MRIGYVEQTGRIIIFRMMVPNNKMYNIKEYVRNFRVDLEVHIVYEYTLIYFYDHIKIVHIHSYI